MTKRKWSNKYKKVLIVKNQKGFHKNNIVNMEEQRKYVNDNELDNIFLF